MFAATTSSFHVLKISSSERNKTPLMMKEQSVQFTTEFCNNGNKTLTSLSSFENKPLKSHHSSSCLEKIHEIPSTSENLKCDFRAAKFSNGLDGKNNHACDMFLDKPIKITPSPSLMTSPSPTPPPSPTQRRQHREKVNLFLGVTPTQPVLPETRNTSISAEDHAVLSQCASLTSDEEEEKKDSFGRPVEESSLGQHGWSTSTKAAASSNEKGTGDDEYSCMDDNIFETHTDLTTERLLNQVSYDSDQSDTPDIFCATVNATLVACNGKDDGQLDKCDVAVQDSKSQIEWQHQHPWLLSAFSKQTKSMDVILTSPGGKRVVGVGSVGRSNYVPPPRSSTDGTSSSSCVPLGLTSSPDAKDLQDFILHGHLDLCEDEDELNEDSGTEYEEEVNLLLLRVHGLEREVEDLRTQAKAERIIRKKKEQNLVQVANQFHQKQLECTEKEKKLEQLDQLMTVLKSTSQIKQEQVVALFSKTVAELSSQPGGIEENNNQVVDHVKTNGNNHDAILPSNQFVKNDSSTVNTMTGKLGHLKEDFKPLELKVTKIHKRERDSSLDQKNCTLRKIMFATFFLGAVLSGIFFIFSNISAITYLCAPVRPGTVLMTSDTIQGNYFSSPWFVPAFAKERTFNALCGNSGLSRFILSVRIHQRTSVEWDGQKHQLVIMTIDNMNPLKTSTMRIKGRKFILEADKIVNIKREDYWSITEAPWFTMR
uniref:Uncharacterized protein n=1 Tax=Corethron hystrix TaxID=216773 RepID=A0A7S1B318_9STRA|mmetsp:Transcript_10897/g.23929  ORF Transcript_10897/g.23929 Transcript_10897/m.23929 type:complete len:710 (+) Transcript_10897:170-2299(+)